MEIVSFVGNHIYNLMFFMALQSLLFIVSNPVECLVKIFITRLLGRFAPIFYLNCEHVLFVYILKQSRKKFRGFLKKNSRIFKIFKNFTKIKTFKHKFLKFLLFINLPWGYVMSHKKFGPDRFSRFDVYWIQTNRQAKFIYR